VAPLSNPSSDTREQILRVARELIETRSYLGFSFQDIADRVGIRKPSLYHHFPTKEALAVAVLSAATEQFERWTATVTGTPDKQLDAYFKMFRHTLRAGYGVCPGGALAPGWDVIDDELKRAVQMLRSVQLEWLARVLSEWMPAKRARAKAAYVFALCQGALLSARITGDVADFDAAIAAGRVELEEG